DVGLDFAIFWAFLIFLLNFIPTFGSLAATIFPVVFSILQFDTWTPVIILLVGILATQMIIGNFLEPKLLGNRLNISSLVVLISLSVWGTIWGVIGMILAVPLTVAIMIILSEFESTLPIAIWLSADGMPLDDAHETPTEVDE
ncbi:MAG: AI-2E family transporter, partial [Bacteroidota bacterium]